MTDFRDHLSLVAHAASPTLGPLSSEHIGELLAPLPPQPGRAALDLGGGRADVALALHDRLGLHVTSVDRSRRICEEGRRRIGTRAITIVERDARQHLEETGAANLALAACLGSTHALGGFVPTIPAVAPVLSPDGALIVGDLVRLTELADQGFGELPSVSDVEQALVAHRFTERARVLVSPAALARYERTWREAVARHLRAHPSPPAAEWVSTRNAAMDRAAARGTLSRVAYLAITASRC